MKENLISFPDDLLEYSDDCIMSNFDGYIDREIEQNIKGANYFSRYAGWNFNGRVYFSVVDNLWLCQVWVYGRPVDVIPADDLDSLMKNVCEEYGYE